jgi:hypothetical protein
MANMTGYVAIFGILLNFPCKATMQRPWGARHSSKHLSHPHGACPVQEIRFGNWLPGMPRPYRIRW